MLKINYRESSLDTPVAEITPGAHANCSPTAVGLQLWGGVECTVNRVGDAYLDQFRRGGHFEREADLSLLAGLGIKALRYPVLWERCAPEGLDCADWSWPDRRLQRLRELGIRPIVGLVHHGSGPRDTSLLDPRFPEKLARYARAVAERYPWADAYTPVNEPLTTARFSALYGLWYPHRTDGRSFLQALMNQCKAVSLAMREIRQVNPQAILVQTDDLGKTFTTPTLAYQAEFENERRWLTWDLLCGRVDHEHPLWDHILHIDQIPRAELEWFLENPCPPDIIGVNHYLTSERFLDERLERYPEWTHGGNGRHRYADVEAVRVRAEGTAGPEALLRETWERYGLPIAVTEAHLGCTREEQLRWLLEVWNGASRLLMEGVDLRAVTAWSLLGAYDWNSLLTKDVGHYEPGVFDQRSGEPRPTALAGLMQDLAAGRAPQHPVLARPGWWRRPERLLYPPVSTEKLSPTASGAGSGNAAPAGRAGRARPLWITGATGTLGRAFSRLCDVRALPHRLTRRQDVDIAIRFAVEDFLDEVRPWAVINTAGYVRVDDAESDVERCLRENRDAAALLAAACARRGIPFVTFSSDLVFDGTKGAAYVESDPTSPLNVYGRSKAEAERQVMEAHPGAMVVRTSAFFGPWDDYNFVSVLLREVQDGRPFRAMSDGVVSPTYVPDLANGVLDLLIDGESGLWHLANQGAVSWHGFAEEALRRSGLPAHGLEGIPTEQLGLRARRPAYVPLTSERGQILGSLEEALERYLREREGPARNPLPEGHGPCPPALA